MGFIRSKIQMAVLGLIIGLKYSIIIFGEPVIMLNHFSQAETLGYFDPYTVIAMNSFHRFHDLI